MIEENRFEKFPKIPRLSRDIIITEKIDGTNAQILIATCDSEDDFDNFLGAHPVAFVHTGDGSYALFAGSRNRWLSLGKGDHHGFAYWVSQNAIELTKLGKGRHYGEWWGKGIRRGYGLNEKRFSLFNTIRWSDSLPSCCQVVPVLYRGPFEMHEIERCLDTLRAYGSWAAPGFPMAEGIVIYHTAGNVMFKKTIENDDKPKGENE